MATNNNTQHEQQGFANMDEQKQKQIASEGSKGSSGTFKNDSQRASEAGSKGSKAHHS